MHREAAIGREQMTANKSEPKDGESTTSRQTSGSAADRSEGHPGSSRSTSGHAPAAGRRGGNGPSRSSQSSARSSSGNRQTSGDRPSSRSGGTGRTGSGRGVGDHRQTSGSPGNGRSRSGAAVSPRPGRDIRAKVNEAPSKETRQADQRKEHEDKVKEDKKQGGGRVKSSHIIEEHIDVGVPRDTVYDQWTQYKEFSKYTKHESANEQDDGKVQFESKIGPSRRNWTTEVVERRPLKRIAWRSVGGAQNMGVISFHRLDKNLTHLMVEMEYHPKGFFEVIGNFFRMPRRRVRKDLKLFKDFIELRGEATGKGPGPLKEQKGLKGQMDERVAAGRG
jgi:uncharacterized membrane protein